MKFISNSKAIFSKHIKFLFLKADNLGRLPQAWLAHASYKNIPCYIFTACFETMVFL